jgi:23S rRNA pseudouridine1911/1915/1917 synthase
MEIIYEDNHIIAAVKPAGFLSQEDSTGKPDMITELRKYLKEKYNKPGNVFVGLVHRLDRPVTGIMLFAKTSKGASRLSEQFRNHTIQKVYYGIVVGKLPQDKGSIKEKVNKIAFFAKGFQEKSDEELLAEIKKATTTRTAELAYEVVKSNEKYSLVKLMPKTGRFHQIRIQMSNLGCPILGDAKYGGEAWNDRESIALQASEITFKKATTDEAVHLKIDLPKSWGHYVV